MPLFATPDVMNHFIKPALAALFIVMIVVGITQAVKHEQKIRIQNVQIKSKAADIKELEVKFDDLNDKYKKTDTNNKQEVDKLNKEKEELEKQKQELERQLQAKLDAKNAEAQRIAQAANKATATSTASAAPAYSGGGNKEQWMSAAGIPQSQWQYVDYIVSKESSWNPSAVNPDGGACGLAQSLPCGKQSKYGHWSDPVANLKWQHEYVNERYGGYAQAYNFWVRNHWY